MASELEVFTKSADPVELRSHDDLGIIPGKQGTVQQLLSNVFVENLRGDGTKAARGALFAVSALLFPLGLGLASKTVVVPSGCIGISTNLGQVLVHGEGRHCLASPFNRKSSFHTYPLTEETIHVMAFWLITVKEGDYGLATDQGKPIILGPGVHIINNPFFNLEKRVKQTESVITHQTLHRVIIPQGVRGVAMDGDLPVLLAPGIYTRVSPVFKFVRALPVDEQVVNLMPFLVITVFTSQIGIAYKRGMLHVLPPGTHILFAEKNEEFVGFIEMTEQVRDLKEIEILTSDGLLVRIHGSISFRISDPVKAITNIGESNKSEKRFEGPLDPETKETKHPAIKDIIFETILTRANNTLAALLTGSDLLTSGGLGFASAAAAMHKKPDPAGSAAKEKAEEGFYQEKERHKIDLSKIIAHEFTGRLTTHLLSEWGVTLTSMSVTDIQVIDEDVKKALAHGVKTSIDATNARRNAEASAETLRIQAAGQADSERIRADGDAYRIREVARAQEEAGKMLERTPVAVTIRLAEAGAAALGKAGSLVCIPDAGAGSLLGLLGAAKAMGAAPHNEMSV